MRTEPNDSAGPISAPGGGQGSPRATGRGQGGVLRVSLDVSAVPTRPAGAGRYTLELALNLAVRPDIELVLVSRSGDAARWRSLIPSVIVRDVVPAPRPLRLAWEQARMPSMLDSLGVDVHHGPHYTMPEAARVPEVVTIHDLTYFDHPEWHERSKVVLFRRAIRVAAAKADALICVSETTAGRLRALFDPKSAVYVIPHGVDHARFNCEEPEPGADSRVLAGLGVHAPYVVFVGTLEPRKNIPSLVSAFDRMSKAHPGLRLVLAGGSGWGAEAVARAVADARHPERVQTLGYVPDSGVPALLRGAAAVAYPSLEEGFGLPALEALACGAPLVTTTGSAMEEIAEGAALLVAPGDTDALAGALDMAVRTDQALEGRRERGLAIAAAHTWRASAEGHLRAYRAAFGSP
ncbi:MAG: glycosyltransferase family 4 protein [Acidimicrobiales bacterium]